MIEIYENIFMKKFDFYRSLSKKVWIKLGH